MAVDPLRQPASQLTHEAASPVQLHLNPEQLQPLIAEVVRTVLREQDASRAILINGKLALREEEAAELLGLNSWQLRDLRRDGKISHSRIVGNKVRYTPNDLLAYMAKNSRPGN